MAADKKVTNVYTKLVQARLMFLQANASKSGKNMHLEFKYFELEDIVPPATRIFSELNLLHIVTFTDVAKMTVIDAENPTDKIEFILPPRELEPIVSKTGNVVTNPLQALGASITYLRRYLWMMCLDIVEADSIDSNLGKEQPAEKVEEKPAEVKKEEPKPEKKKTKPKTAAERKEIAKGLTSPEGPADELQIAALKKACADLVKLNPEDEKLTNFVKTLGEKTKMFTEISKSDATKVIENIGVMIKSYYKDGKEEQ